MPQMPNIMGIVQNFMQNPFQFMIQRRFNIPQNLAQNPQGMVQHLLDSGQITQQQLNQARQMLPQFQQYLNGGGNNGQNPQR